MKRLSERDLHRFTHVDHVDRVAFVVLLGDQIVAVGRFDRLSRHRRRRGRLPRRGRPPGPRARLGAARAPRRRRPRARDQALRRRGAGPEQQDGAGLPGRRLQVRALLRGRRRPPDVPDRADRGRPRRRLRARAAQRVAVDRAAAHARRRSRSSAPATTRARSATRCCGTCSSTASPGPVYPVNPGARHVRGVPAYADIESIPDDVDLAVLAVPADEVAGVVEACRRKRVRGLVVVSGGFGETGPEGRDGRAAAGRRRPRLRACGWSGPTASAS